MGCPWHGHFAVSFDLDLIRWCFALLPFLQGWVGRGGHVVQLAFPHVGLVGFVMFEIVQGFLESPCILLIN